MEGMEGTLQRKAIETEPKLWIISRVVFGG